MPKDKGSAAPKDDASNGSQDTAKDDVAEKAGDPASPQSQSASPKDDASASSPPAAPPAPNPDPEPEKEPEPLDPKRSNASLLEQFMVEAIDAGYAPRVAAHLAAERLENLRSGGTGFDLGPVKAGQPVVLKAPDGVSGASVDGVSYDVKDGTVTVPEAHVAKLLDHGFTR